MMQAVPRRPTSVAQSAYWLSMTKGGGATSSGGRAFQQRFEVREAGGDGAGVVHFDTGAAGVPNELLTKSE